MPAPEQSEANLNGVRADLVAVVHRAVEICPQAFMVFEGLRTRDRQRALMSMGVTKTMDSKHLTGDAVDLVPLRAGKPVWEWDLIYPIATAMRQAAQELGTQIRWGGFRDVLNGTTETVRDLVATYVRECKDDGHKALIDGPHFEVHDAPSAT